MRYRSLLLLGFVALVAAILLVILPKSPSKPPSPPSTANLAAASNTVVTHRSTTTTTTIPPGDLPQTRAYPRNNDPLFLTHIKELVAAAASDRPSLALSAFFPLNAYIQVKAISDPVTDWHVRLVADYGVDIGIVHRELGPDAKAAKFLSVSIPSDALWVKPGVEYNKGSYWRVYGTTVYCTVGSHIRHFEITSMISWRGEWYVVHLGVIR